MMFFAMTVHNPKMKKDIVIELSMQVYHARVYKMTIFVKLYNCPFRNIGHKTTFLEHFIEIVKNNTQVTILLYRIKIFKQQYKNK